MSSSFSLIDLGWDSFFEKQLTDADRADAAAARVVEEMRTSVRLMDGAGEFLAESSGRLRRAAEEGGDLPAVGDFVVARRGAGGGHGVVLRVLARRSRLARKVAGEVTREQVLGANVDTIFLVVALDRDFSVRRVERYLTALWESGASPVVLLNKADLRDDAADAAAEVESAAPGVPVHAVSAATGDGVDALRAYAAPGRTVALVGSSGVGKSSLVNRLAGRDEQATGEIAADAERGRHTTTSRRLVVLPSMGLLLDMPGIRELQLWDGGGDALARTFGDVEEAALRCRFGDCRHESEPGCAVAAAIAEGALDPERLASFRKLRRELAHLERKQDAVARIAERQVWKRRTMDMRRRQRANGRDVMN